MGEDEFRKAIEAANRQEAVGGDPPNDSRGGRRRKCFGENLPGAYDSKEESVISENLGIHVGWGKLIFQDRWIPTDGCRRRMNWEG